MASDKDKNKYSEKNIKSMKVAIFCIAAIVIFYFGCSFLKGLNIFGHKSYYYAVFENVGNLHESTNVAINGYPIGKVNKISILNTDPVRICAEILVTEDVDIPEDSYLEVAQKDVLGGMIVNVIMGKSNRMAHNKDTLACGLQPGMFDGIDDLKAQLSSVLASVDTIGQTVKSAFLMNDPNNGALMLKNTLINLEASTQHLNKMLANNEQSVGNIVNKLDKLSSTLSNAAPQLEAIINNINNISDSVAQSNIRTLVTDAQEAVANINSLTASIERGEGSAGLLMKNDSLYSNVNKTVESLDILLKDLKANPSKYINVTVFGKKNKN